MKKLIMLRKQLLLIVLLLTSGIAFSYAATPFVTIWRTTNVANAVSAGGTPSDDHGFRIPVRSGTFSGSYIKVGANENTRVAFTNGTGSANGFLIGGLMEAGDYELHISAVSEDFAFAFGNATSIPATTAAAGDRYKIIAVKQWGDVCTFNTTFIFGACQNLEVTATDSPKLSGSIGGMFKFCTTMTGNAAFNNWDLTSVTSMNLFFQGAAKFNQPLDKWNLKNVVNIGSIFDGAAGLSCYNFSVTLGGWANNAETPAGRAMGTLPAGLTYGDQAAYTKLTTPVESGGMGWTIAGATYDVACAAFFRTIIADIKTGITDGQLWIRWKTSSEHDNDRFIIYVSENDKDWQEAGEVISKAEEGNSIGILDYEYTVNTGNLQMASAAWLAILISVCQLFKRRRSFAGAMILLAILFFSGCVKERHRKGIYIKITQVAKDGVTTSDTGVLYAREK